MAIELRQVLEALRDVGVLGAEHFLTNVEGAAEERFGVAVAALVMVEPRQVVEGSGGVGVIGAARFLINVNDAAEERFGVAVLCPFLEVEPSVVQQRCSSLGLDVPLAHPIGTDLGMGYQTLTNGPNRNFRLGKHPAKRKESTLSPLSFRFRPQILPNHSLREPVEAVSVRTRQTLHQ